MAITDFEDIFTYVGGFGRYQLMLFAVHCYMNILLAFVYYGQLFMTLTPPHWCRPPPGTDDLGLTLEEVKQLTVPLDPITQEYSKCTRYDVNVTTIIQKNTSGGLDHEWNITHCTYGWEYDYSLYYPTITSQLNWVCGDDWKPALSQSLFFIGSLVGLPILGWAADRWGRLPIIVLTNMMGGLAGIASAFTNSIASFATLRFVVGLTFDTYYLVAYILLLEYVASKYRTVMSNVPIMTFLTAAMCALPWIAYLLADWSALTIVIHAPQLLCFFFIWLLPESARWLLSKGRLDETLRIIQKVAKVNGKEIPKEFIQEFKDYGEKRGNDDNGSAGVLDLLKTPVLRMRFLVLCVMWVTITIAYDGHMRNTENIGYNVFISFTILGFVELPADFLTMVSVETLGRRHTTVSTLILSGLACFVIVALPSTSTIAIFSMAIVGRFLITMAINVGQQYPVEVLPTVARSSGSGMIHTLGSASAFVSPYVIYLSKYGHFLPYLILGMVSVVGGAICALLPETLNETLPDSLHDGENYFADQGCCYNPCAARKKMNVTSANEASSQNQL